MFRPALCFVGISLLVALPLVSDSKFQLTIDNIMRGPNLVGTEPAQVRWSGDSSKIYFQWKQAGDSIIAPLDTYVANRDGSGLRKLSDEEARTVPPAVGVDVNEDRTLGVYSDSGDIFVVENATGKRRQLTKTSDAETNPRFLPDGHRITFVRGGNLYVMSLDNGDLEQLTDIRPAAAGGAAPAAGAGGGRGGRGGGGGRGGAAASSSDEPKGTDAQEYLKKEQREMFDVVREREKLKEETDAKQKKLNPRKPYTLQARQTTGQMQLSPDGKYVLAVISETANGTKNSAVPTWITDSSFPEDLTGRARVGDGLGQRHLAIINVETGEVKQVDHGDTGTPAAEMEDGGGCGGGGGARAGGFGQGFSFSPDGSKAVFSARSQDNKNCWIFALDPATAKARILASEHDAAWIGGQDGGQGWLGDNRTYYFTSERDGFNHLYEVAYDGGQPNQLTSGKFEVDRAVLSRDKSTFYLTTSEGSFYERHLWSMPVGGGERTRITKLPGGHQATLSPDEKSIADIYSYTNKPPEVYVMENKPMAEAKKVTESPAPEFHSYPWIDTPIVEITTRDGAKLPASLYKSAGYKKGGPAVIFVHGSGYLQNVDHWWSSAYYHEYLFHHFLMEHGYLVLAVDYRASKGYGRDWRTAIYRHMGGKDLDDQVDAAKWLVAQQGVDPKRIGIYGGSYGGFITLMAMFTQPDVFAAGAALRPVSDWAYYNQGYTGNILNQPQKDAEAYRQSSPIYFAAGLKGHLLICHGMVDTNVHYIDTVRLAQKLIELHKENWELASYPVEDHSFVQPSSWADEYKRIFRLFETSLKN
ncbi:MAG TPA: alpha/beta fold hydrolase [Bryobacteraceae bacterium]|nr:alpha/beta fold hydrolase [Bryobacteraceae bacterium]